MNEFHQSPKKSLKQRIFVYVLSGASLSSGLFAQEKKSDVKQPQWATPVQDTNGSTLPNSDKVAPTLGLFEMPQQNEAPEPKPLLIQTELNTTKNQEISTSASTTIVADLPAPVVNRSFSIPKNEGRPTLSDPLTIHGAQSKAGQTQQSRSASVIQDHRITQAGNTEPQLLTPNESGTNPFPNDDALRMTPPKASLFAETAEQKPTEIHAPNSFPNENLDIPPIDPTLIQPVPDKVAQPFNKSTVNQLPSVQQAEQHQKTYDPPVSQLNTATQQPSVAQSQVQEAVHEVQPGENYWTISRKHFGTARYFAALAEYNKHRISRPDRMKPGMFVLVPDAEVLEQRYPKIAGIIDAKPSPESLLKPGFFIGPNNQPLYRIGKGDTLTEIAETHLGRTARWSQIVGMNRDLLRDGNNLKIGMVLRLPHDASQVSLAPPVQ